jgi:predicted chitinase
MKLERVKKQLTPVATEPQKKPVTTPTIPVQAKAATPAQLQRAKARLEQDRTQIQRQAEQAKIQRETRAKNQEQARIQRLQDQAAARDQQVRLQRLADTQARQQSFFSSFVKPPIQRQSQQQVKTSSIQTAQTRDQYQAAVQPEMLQRLVDDQLSLPSQQARASQPQNALNARADWFNTELPVLRAKHNHPDTPFSDTASVFKPTDQQAFALGNTYKLQRLSHGLTPRDAATAILNIQRKQDRDIAMRGLLTGINPRQSDYTSVQRLVTQGEADLELQRTVLSEDPAMQSQALQLAKDAAHPTSPNSGISEKIQAKLGGGNPLPENIRQQLEMGLNTDLSSVRVHTDSDADFLSKSVHAKAFTTGNNIFFSSGAFDPNTKWGYELIAHETTHTLQQASGQVQPGIDSDPSLETAAQTKGAELAAGFNPNFKYKNLENQAQPNSPLIASQPPAHRAKIQAMQRSNLNVQREPQTASPVVTPTVSQALDETALATLTTALLPVVPQKYQADAQSNIPVILRQCFSSQITNANQVAYILATAQHESRFGTELYSRSESLVEDHNPLKTEHKKVGDKKTKKTHVEDIPYRINHVNSHRINADPSNTDNLDTYYDDAYGGKLGNAKNTSDAANYRGRGFVQITGRDNYERLGKQIQKEGFTYTFDKITYGTKEHPIDLVANPTHVNLVPELAAKIMVSGMQNDSFAQGGTGLSTYVNDKTTDFVGARGLVNGTDRAADIAKIAENFAKVLTANNAWGNLFKAPDLTKQAPDLTKPGVTPGQTMQRSSLGIQRQVPRSPPSPARVHNMAYDALLQAMAADMSYKKELSKNDENLLKEFGYHWSENINGKSGLQMRLFYPSQKSYPHAVLAFRGTEAGLNAEGARDILADVDPIGAGHPQWRDNQTLIKNLLNLASKKTHSRVWVTGHSLGGAVAQYAGAHFPDLVGRIITFQAPAITGTDVSKLENHNRNHPRKRVNSTHYEVENDKVPNSPHYNPIGRHLRNIALGGVRKTPGTLTTFKPLDGSKLNSLEAHLARPLYNQLGANSPEAYGPFERNGFISGRDFQIADTVQRARATESSQLVIQASREGTSPQALESTPTPQFAIQNVQRSARPTAPLISSSLTTVQRSALGIQRDPKPQSGTSAIPKDPNTLSKAQAQQYRIMLNSSPHSSALKAYMNGEAKQKLASGLAQANATDRTDETFVKAMNTFFNDRKAQSIFVLGKVLDPQTTVRIKDHYNKLDASEKQVVLNFTLAEANSIPIAPSSSYVYSEKDLFDPTVKFIEFCLYKVLLVKYPDLAKVGAAPDKNANTIDKPQAGINQAGFIEYKGGKELEGSNIRSGPAELGGKALTGNPLPPGTRVFVSGTHPKKPEWYYVTAFVSDGLVRGYVQNFRVTTKLPEPGAVLHFVQQDEALEPTAAKIYRQSIKPGRDLRFYENATLHINKEDGRSGVYRGTSRTTGQESVMLQAGSLVWLVSPAFANTLQDIVPSGSITGGAWAKAKEVGRHLEDILSSVTNSPNFFGEVAGEYRDAIMDHLPEIIGITAGFIAAEALSAFLAATPTGVGQLAAAVIQLGLAAFGAKGAIDAGVEALKHAQAWLTSSWTANGDPQKLAFASKEFLKMLVSIALAALATLGAKANIDKGLKIASSIKITPPSIAMMQPAYAGGGGYAAPIPVFQPGSITAAPVAISPMNPMAAIGAGGSRIKSEPEKTPEPQITSKDISDEALEKLLEKTKNWDEIKDFIGKPADKTKPAPPGYSWREKGGRLELVRKDAKSGDLAPLTVENGLIVLKVGGSSRLSIFSRYRGNYLKWVRETQGEAAYKEALSRLETDGNALHHLIPDAVVRNHPLTLEAMKRVSGYTLDRGTNILDMPIIKNLREDIIHSGSHPEFNNYVSQRLDLAVQALTNRGATPLSSVNPVKIDEALHGVENYVRSAIQNKTLPPKVLRELEEGGVKLR